MIDSALKLNDAPGDPAEMFSERRMWPLKKGSGLPGMLPSAPGPAFVDPALPSLTGYKFSEAPEAQVEAWQKLAARGKELGLRFYQFSLVDLFGVMRAKLVPAARVEDIASSGAGFASFAAYFATGCASQRQQQQQQQALSPNT